MSDRLRIATDDAAFLARSSCAAGGPNRVPPIPTVIFGLSTAEVRLVARLVSGIMTDRTVEELQIARKTAQSIEIEDWHAST